MAAQEKTKIPGDARVSAIVGIGPRDDGEGFGIGVDLEVSLPGFEKSRAEDLVAKARVVCPYSHARKRNVDLPSAAA